MKTIFWLSILSTLLILPGCYENIDNTEIVTISEKPDIKVSTSINGVYLGSQGETNSNYVLEFQQEQIFIDKKHFNISLDQVNKKNQRFSIYENDLESSFIITSLIENDFNLLEIKAFPEHDIHNFASSESKVISINSNLDLLFAENAFDENPAIHTRSFQDDGLINQVGHYALDLNSNDLFPIFDEVFQIHSDVELKTKGSMSISFSSLDLNGKYLFFLNEASNQWNQILDLSESSGDFEINSFGYYAIGSSQAATFKEGILEFEGKVLSYQTFDISGASQDQIYTRSSANGRWSSYVADVESLTLELTNPCNEVIGSADLKINQASQTIETDLSLLNEDPFIELNYESVDCNGDYIETPAILIDETSEDQLFIFPPDQKDNLISVCDINNINAYDLENEVAGSGIEWNEMIDDEVGLLTTCSEFKEGFSFFIINKETELLPPFTKVYDGTKTILKSEDESFIISFKGNTTGAYLDENINIFINNMEFGQNGYFTNCLNSEAGCGIDDFYVSHLSDTDGDFTRISFSGTLWMQTIENPVAGYYKIEGQIITPL